MIDYACPCVQLVVYVWNNVQVAVYMHVRVRLSMKMVVNDMK